MRIVDGRKKASKIWLNYGLILNEEKVDLKFVNSLIYKEFINSQIAMQQLKDDLPKFHEFKSFDVTSIQQVKTRAMVDTCVEKYWVDQDLENIAQQPLTTSELQ